MKTYKTNNGNLLFNLFDNELILLKSKNEIQFTRGNFTTIDAIEKGIKGFDASGELKQEAYEFIINSQKIRLNDAKETRVDLEKYRSYFGQLPQWVVENFKSEVAYNKFKEKQLVKLLQKQFKLKSQKAVREQICIVYTVEYTGKNNGFKHFNRYLNSEYDLISNLSDYSRRKNFAAKKLNGEIIEIRGNISPDEI